VPVTREEVRLERVPVTDDDPADEPAGPGGDVILHAEQPVVSTQTVPVERVRLGKETVVHEETVTRPVRREQIEYEGPDR
jgi:stress response protein YsnF